MKKRKKTPAGGRKPLAFSRGVFHEVVARNLTTKTDTSDEVLVLMPMHTSLLALERGCLNHETFWEISDGITFGHALGHVLHDDAAGDINKKDRIAPAAQVFADAMDVFQVIAERFGKTGKWGATGEEIKTLRLAASWADDLFSIATKGHVTRAMLRAESLRKQAFSEAKRVKP
jgi:hypothetical protein